jgi:MFS family permease
MRREAIIPPKRKQVPSTIAFQHPAYRTYFIGQLISMSGTWMQAVAQQVVVYNLTGSELALGLTAFAQGLPALILTPIAGVIADSFPKRKVLVVTQLLMMTLALILAALQFAGALQVWHIITLSFLLGILNALDAPARQAITIDLVGHEHLPSGIAMNAIMFNTARIVGPMIGGFALATVGPAWCFLLNGLSFLGMISGLLLIRVQSAVKPPAHFEVIKPLVAGLRFARSHPVIGPILVLAAINSCFGIGYATQIPPYAKLTLDNVEVGTSVLQTAQGVGTVIAAVWMARMTNSGKRGRILFTFTLFAPLAVILLGLTRSFALAIPLNALASGGFIAQFISMNTLLQHDVPDDLRGRILSLYTLTFFGLGPLANLLLGAIAQAFTAPVAMVIFGVVALLGGAYIVVIRAKHLRTLP